MYEKPRQFGSLNVHNFGHLIRQPSTQFLDWISISQSERNGTRLWKYHIALSKCRIFLNQNYSFIDAWNNKHILQHNFVQCKQQDCVRSVHITRVAKYCLCTVNVILHSKFTCKCVLVDVWTLKKSRGNTQTNTAGAAFLRYQIRFFQFDVELWNCKHSTCNTLDYILSMDYNLVIMWKIRLTVLCYIDKSCARNVVIAWLWIHYVCILYVHQSVVWRLRYAQFYQLHFLPKVYSSLKTDTEFFNR